MHGRATGKTKLSDRARRQKGRTCKHQQQVTVWIWCSKWNARVEQMRVNDRSFTYWTNRLFIYLFIFLIYIYAELDKNIDWTFVNICITICIYFCFQKVAQTLKLFFEPVQISDDPFCTSIYIFFEEISNEDDTLHLYLKESLEIQRIWNLAKLVSNRAIERRCKLLKGEGKRGRKNVSLARRRIGIEINQTR